MTNGDQNVGSSSKIKGYGVTVGVVVGLLTAIFAFGAEVLDRMGPDDPRPPTSKEESDRTYSDYDTVTSDGGILSVEMPSKWDDVAANEAWAFPDSSGKVVGPAIHASTSLTLWYGARFDVPGLSFVASNDPIVLARDEPELLEVDDGFFSDICSFRDERDAFDNGTYAMKRDVWKGCGPKEAEVWHIVATPENHAYVAMLEITIASKADRKAAERILNTFKVDEAALSSGDVSADRVSP